jgi:Ca2+-binding RTX toxin-like protein
VTVDDSAHLDREAVGSNVDVTVRATSADGSTADTTFSVALGDVDEFDVAAPVDNNGATDSVNENAANGTAVNITAFSHDDDATTNAVTYSIVDSYGSGDVRNGLFTVGLTSGIVTVADSAQLDREAVGGSVDVTVRATSTDGSTADTTFSVAIGDLDEFDVTAPVDNNAATNAVNENAANGTAVGVTAFSHDDDATTNAVAYSIVDSYGSGDVRNGLFTVGSTSGIVTIADSAHLDREALGASVDVTVRAISADGSIADSTFSVALGDMDEFDVTAPVDNNGTANAVDENAANGTGIGITASAHDDDATTNAVTYAIVDSYGLGDLRNGLFTVGSTSGIVTVADSAHLDREAVGASVDVTVRATSADGSIADTTFSVTIDDLNDNAPVIQTSTAVHFTVNENSAGGASVGAVSATDDDETSPNNQVSYAITGGSAFGLGLFDIDSLTGAIIVHTGAALNFEGTSSYTVQVTASDGGSPLLSDIETFTIDLSDVNEAPVVNAGQTFTPNENVQFVGNVVAADEDVGTFHSIVYSLVPGASDNSLFTIDASTGALRFVSTAGSDGADPLGEHGPNYVVDVKVTDGSNPSLTTHQTVAVTAQSIGPITNNGTTGNDTEYGTQSADTLKGNAGNDTIYGGASGDNIDGGSGNDTLFGGVGGDTILGGAGNDKLYGGAGADMLTGGSGADRFHFNTPSEGIDTITDFLSANSVLADKIALDRAGFGIGLSTTTADLFGNGALSFHDGGLWWKGADASLPEVEFAIVQSVATLTSNDLLLV